VRPGLLRRGDYDTGMDGGWQQLLDNYRASVEA
jgi:hypothetical protein